MLNDDTLNASEAEVVHPQGGANYAEPAGAAGDGDAAEPAPPQEEPFRLYRTKEEWQAEIDRIIGKRLGENRRAKEAAAMLDEFAALISPPNKKGAQSCAPSYFPP